MASVLRVSSERDGVNENEKRFVRPLHFKNPLLSGITAHNPFEKQRRIG